MLAELGEGKPVGAVVGAKCGGGGSRVCPPPAGELEAGPEGPVGVSAQSELPQITLDWGRPFPDSRGWTQDPA